MLDQLPSSVQIHIFTDFLYDAFVRTFRKRFCIFLPDNPQKHAYFTWDMDIYADFMIDLLTHLEPRFEPQGKVLIDELQEVLEVIMFMNGKFDLGFELNGKKSYVIRYSNTSSTVQNAGALIGDHSCTFNKQSRFIYKTVSPCDGFFIRKKSWMDVLTTHSYVARSF
jgi:hypothetical protein